jgi:hypothetical protein
MPKAVFPHARSEGLVITDLDDEILIYDKNRDKAHCLNVTAALVWKLSNGKRSASDIAQAMAKKIDSPVDEQVVWFALRQLEKDHLLQNEITMPRALAGITRREFVKKMGMAAVAVTAPIVISMTAPQSALAATCLSNESPCTSSTQCCSGCCGGPFIPGQGTCQPISNCT